MAAIPSGSFVSRPSCALKHLHRSQTRSLSTSQPRSAQTPTMSQGSMMKNMPRQSAMSSRMRRLKRSEIPNDIGLIPQTFIRPCGNMPGWWAQPMLRARLEFLYLKQGFADFAMAYYFKRWSLPRDPLTNRRKKMPLELRDRHAVARSLHEELNTALATGDKPTINKIACSGLANEQHGRLDRDRIEGKPIPSWTVKYNGWTLPAKLYWTLQLLVPSYLKSVHVLADRQIQLPVGAGILLRQVIVRIDSTQTLNRNNGSEPVTKRMREYVVLQRAVIEDEPEDWRIWGTIDATTPEGALEIIQAGKTENGSMMDRMRTMFPSFM